MSTQPAVVRDRLDMLAHYRLGEWSDGSFALTKKGREAADVLLDALGNGVYADEVGDRFDAVYDWLERQLEEAR